MKPASNITSYSGVVASATTVEGVRMKGDLPMGDRKMRVAICFIAVVALGLAAAPTRAGVIVSAERTGTVNGFDEITFRIAAFTEPEASRPGGDSLAAIEGTFSAVGPGATLSVPGTSITYPGRTTNTDGTAQENPAESYVNFDSIVSSSFNRTPATTTPTALTGTWFTTSPALRLRPVDPDLNDEFDQTLLAQIYVTPGADVSFAGTYGSFSTPAGALAFTSVPEPSLLAVFAAGGLLILRRRGAKRAG